VRGQLWSVICQRFSVPYSFCCDGRIAARSGHPARDVVCAPFVLDRHSALHGYTKPYEREAELRLMICNPLSSSSCLFVSDIDVAWLPSGTSSLADVWFEASKGYLFTAQFKVVETSITCVERMCRQLRCSAALSDDRSSARCWGSA
jgi:hypothetical protein